MEEKGRGIGERRERGGWEEGRRKEWRVEEGMIVTMPTATNE